MGCLWARDLPTDLPMLTELCACALVCASAAQIGRGRQYFAHAPKRTISQFRVEGCNLHLDVPPPPRDLHVVEERGAGQRPTWRVQWVAPRLSEDGEEIAEYCVELCHEDLLGRDTGRRGGGLASHDDSGGLGGAAGEHVQGGGARLRVDASGAISGTTTSKGGASSGHAGDGPTRGQASGEASSDPTRFTSPREVWVGSATVCHVDVDRMRVPPGTAVELRVSARNAAGYGAPALVRRKVGARPVRTSLPSANQQPPPPPAWRGIDLADLLGGGRSDLLGGGESKRQQGGAASQATESAAARFAAVHAVWSKHVSTLKVLFRFFCLQVHPDNAHMLLTQQSYVHCAFCGLCARPIGACAYYGVVGGSRPLIAI